MTRAKRWDTENLAKNRAKRKQSSAPTSAELLEYKKYLKIAIRGRKNPRVLVLGATPELRDMAIGLGCETMAADVSMNVIAAMAGAMKFSGNSKDVIIRADWLKLGEILTLRYFDAVLADASLNNVLPEGQKKLLADMATLLKKDGYFITRHIVYDPNEPQQDLKVFQKWYDQDRVDWLMFVLIFLAYYSQYSCEIYNPTTKVCKIHTLFDITEKLIREKKIKYRADDLAKIKNVIAYGRQVVHYIFPKKEFEELAGKYFKIETTVQTPRWVSSKFIPIYVFRKK